MKKILFLISVVFWFIITGNVLAWNISYHKNSFWSTDYTAYLCDDYTYWSCNEWEAKYTVWIKLNDFLWETIYYYCKWWVYECSSRNSFSSERYSSY